MLAHPARFLSFVSHRFHRFAQIILRCKQWSYTHQVSLQKTPKESKICENLWNLWENSTFNIKHQPMRKETIKKIINLIITVLTAIASAICVQSCK